MDGHKNAIGRILQLVIAITVQDVLTGQSLAPSDPQLRFEVAVIKRGDPAARLGGTMDVQKPDRYSATNTPMDVLLRYAYGVSNKRIVGAPAWFRSTRFTIIAKAERAVSPAEKKEMVRNLLRERFALSFREEEVELPHWAFVLNRSDGRLGPNLRRSSEECSALAEELSQTYGMEEKSRLTDRHPACRSEALFPDTKGQTASRLGAITLSTFAFTLEALSDRPVVDRTNLTGRFDLVLNGRIQDLLDGGNPNATADSPPSIFVALPEQLGLKLESRRGPVPVLVVEHAELPTYD